jgi:hypothetical protein
VEHFPNPVRIPRPPRRPRGKKNQFFILHKFNFISFNNYCQWG